MGNELYDEYDFGLSEEELAEIEVEAEKEASAEIEDLMDSVSADDETDSSYDDYSGEYNTDYDMEDDYESYENDNDYDNFDELKANGNEIEENESTYDKDENTNIEDSVSDVVHIDANRAFFNDVGEITVMDNEITEDTFTMSYIDIGDIVVTDRIRKGTQVEWLVKSIKATGLIEPLVIAPTEAEGVYVLLHGMNRLLACAKAGVKKVPCVINNKVSTTEIKVVEALYNRAKKYTMTEIVDYVNYLETEKGVRDSNMIEYLLQLNSGDYSKLKDVINDNDDEIVPKLLDGTYTISEAFRKLEQRRKKETPEEKEARIAQKAMEQGSSVLSGIKDSGETAEDEGDALTDEEIASICFNASELDNGLEDKSLDEMVKEGNEIEGFKPHKQKTGERERIDPAIKKATLARDKFICQCCQRGGESFVDALDFHHVLPVFLGGNDSVDNGITLCLTCHHLVHNYSFGDLHLPQQKTEDEIEGMEIRDKILYEDEQKRFKRIVKLGTVIREGMALKGIKKENAKKENPTTFVGRRMPGTSQASDI